MSIVEVYNERITDLLVLTKKGEAAGEVIIADASARKKRGSVDDDVSVKTNKLEIRTDSHGEVVVQGSLSVQVYRFEDVCEVWKDVLSKRRQRLLEQGFNPDEYERSAHIIATLKVQSLNIATGMGSIGKVQFVDLAKAGLVPAPVATTIDTKADPALQELTRSVTGDKDLHWKFESRWASIFGEVVVARSQYSRAVPYRSSTLTHLLSDSLEHDTKVVMLACVSSDADDAQETATTLRLASRARRVWLGKATKHTLESPLPK